MRTEITALLAATLLAGCAATAPRVAPRAATAAALPACTPPVQPRARPDLCRYPADVRAFVQDRDACEHFRGEPWPESDSPDDAQRRRALVEGVRTACAGTDRQLADLKARYGSNPSVLLLLSSFDERIEQ